MSGSETLVRVHCAQAGRTHLVLREELLTYESALETIRARIPALADAPFSLLVRAEVDGTDEYCAVGVKEWAIIVQDTKSIRVVGDPHDSGEPDRARGREEEPTHQLDQAFTANVALAVSNGSHENDSNKRKRDDKTNPESTPQKRGRQDFLPAAQPATSIHATLASEKVTWPEVKGSKTPIHITFNCYGSSTCFRTPRSTQLTKLQSAYAKKIGKSVDDFRFIYKGRQMRDEDATPDTLDMKDNTTIFVLQRVVGGGPKGSKSFWSPCAKLVGNNSITEKLAWADTVAHLQTAQDATVHIFRT